MGNPRSNMEGGLNPSLIERPSTTQVVVGIIEDQRRTREGLCALINASQEFVCPDSWESVEDALEKPWSFEPRVILTDLGLPGMSGIEGMRLLRRRFPNAALVVLTVYEDNDRIFRALCAGASGYLLKNTPPAKLIEGLRDAMRGGAPISPEIALKVVELFRKFRPPDRADYNLTPHEIRLLKLLVEGHSYKTAAGVLKVSINTIAFHVQNIYSKLQVHSKSEAVARALKENLVG
jgi:DNA-binding NarL/FixJ family response regulator